MLSKKQRFVVTGVVLLLVGSIWGILILMFIHPLLLAQVITFIGAPTMGFLTGVMLSDWVYDGR